MIVSDQSAALSTHLSLGQFVSSSDQNVAIPLIFLSWHTKKKKSASVRKYWTTGFEPRAVELSNFKIHSVELCEISHTASPSLSEQTLIILIRRVMGDLCHGATQAEGNALIRPRALTPDWPSWGSRARATSCSLSGHRQEKTEQPGWRAEADTPSPPRRHTLQTQSSCETRGRPHEVWKFND